MKMEVYRISKILVAAGLCLCFTVAVDALQNQDCACGGPTNYYKELGCTPIFKNTDDCCPIRYDCSVVKNLTNEQCLISGHVYRIGESVRSEDANACDWCQCAEESRGRGKSVFFACAIPSCAMPFLPNESCRYIMTDNCCGGRVICPKEDGSFATCVVDGKTYSDGEEFIPSAEPDKRCRCADGYTGKNVEPYCVSPKHTWCTNVIWAQEEIRTCVPVYSKEASLTTGCNDGFRCPTSGDIVIERTNEDATKEPEDPDMVCEFGNLTMRIGDELNKSKNIKCVCDVPPVPTCRQENSD